MEDDYYMCPQCGGDVRVGSYGCPICVKPPKARERKFWEQDETNDGLSLPDDEFDYDDFAARELGVGKPKRTTKEKIFWWTAVILIVVWLM
jgi:hypothetical protein